MLERSFGCLVSVLKRKIGEYHIHNWGVRRLFAFLRFCIYSNPNSVNAFECLKLVVWTIMAKNRSKWFENICTQLKATGNFNEIWLHFTINYKGKMEFSWAFYGFVLYTLAFFNFTLKNRQVRFKGILDILLVWFY